MMLIACGNCGQRVAVTATRDHADACRRSAKAIEAQRAETTKIGSVEDESAVPQGFAQKGSA